jgi:hypothetical protein
MYSLFFSQAVSCQPFTMEVSHPSEASPRKICGEQSGTGTGFAQSTSVPPQYNSTNAPHSLIYQQCYIIFEIDIIK